MAERVRRMLGQGLNPLGKSKAWWKASAALSAAPTAKCGCFQLPAPFEKFECSLDHSLHLLGKSKALWKASAAHSAEPAVKCG
jgi:hypothetical protein